MSSGRAAGERRPAMPAFTVLTVNTHKGFALFNRRLMLHDLREAVRRVSADLVFLQEVQGSHDRHARRHGSAWPEAPHYEYLADSIWKDFAYGRNAVYPEGHHGNALLSKFPILRHENHDASVQGHEERGLLHCVLDAKGTGTEVHAICAHLGLREAHRTRQFEQLCTMIETTIPADAPLIVAGDFNDWRQRGHRLLQGCAGLREVFVERFGRFARTFPARFPLLALDRIYVRNVDVVEPLVLSHKPWSHLSDHAALAAHLRLPALAPPGAPA